jgi:hypothetical protein
MERREEEPREKDEKKEDTNIAVPVERERIEEERVEVKEEGAFEQALRTRDPEEMEIREN